MDMRYYCPGGYLFLFDFFMLAKRKAHNVLNGESWAVYFPCYPRILR